MSMERIIYVVATAYFLLFSRRLFSSFSSSFVYFASSDRRSLVYYSYFLFISYGAVGISAREARRIIVASMFRATSSTYVDNDGKREHATLINGNIFIILLLCYSLIFLCVMYRSFRFSFVSRMRWKHDARSCDVSSRRLCTEAIVRLYGFVC